MEEPKESKEAAEKTLVPESVPQKEEEEDDDNQEYPVSKIPKRKGRLVQTAGPSVPRKQEAPLTFDEIVKAVKEVNEFYTKQKEQEKQTQTSPVSMDIINQLGIRSLIIISDPLNFDDYLKPKNVSDCTLYSGTMWLNFKTVIAHDIESPMIASRSLYDYLLSCNQLHRLLANWRIYTFPKDDALIVCIPKGEKFDGYLAKTKDFSAGGEGKNISDGELLLGIKVNRLKEIEPPSPLPTETKKPTSPDNLKQYLSDILVTHADLKGWGESYSNIWDIYLTGHGGELKGQMYLAGISTSSFNAVLDFFNLGINTRTLFYETCFAGGTNLKTPYQYTNKEVQERNFKFTIIAGTTFFSETISHTSNFPLIDKRETKKLGEPFYIKRCGLFVDDFDTDEYFKQLNEYFTNFGQANIANLKKDQTSKRAKKAVKDALEERITLADVIKNISDWSTSLDPEHRYLKIPSIRFPNTGWFKVAQIKQDLFTIDNSKIMRAVNQGNNKITVPADTKMILLEEQYIPVEIWIQGDKMPLLVPKKIDRDEGDLDYFLAKIVAPDITLIDDDASAQDDFKTMILSLKNKAPNVGNFFIEKFFVKVGNQTTKEGEKLDWGDEAVLLRNVVVNVQVTERFDRFITVTHKKKHFIFFFANNYWESREEPLVNFETIKETMAKYSTLPESMNPQHTKNPEPILEQPLLHSYMQKLDDKDALSEWKNNLSEKQEEKLKQLKKQMKKNIQ
jgi:hypothetical protein